MLRDLSYSMLRAKIQLYSSSPISSYKKRSFPNKALKSKKQKYRPLIRDSSTVSMDAKSNNGPSFDSASKNLRGSLSTNSMTNSHSSMRYAKPVIEGKSSITTRKSLCSMQKIVTENTKSFLDSLNKKQPVFLSNPNNYQCDNLKDLQDMLSSLQSEAFEKVQIEIDEKKVIKTALESSINEIKHQIHIYGNTKRYWEKENAKVLNKIYTIQSSSKNYVSEKHSINEYKASIQPLKDQAILLNNETLQMREEILEDKVAIQHKEDEIKKYNLMITEIERERDELRSTIQVISNHKKKIATRVQNTTQKNSDIMLKWTSFCKQVINE